MDRHKVDQIDCCDPRKGVYKLWNQEILNDLVSSLLLGIILFIYLFFNFIFRKLNKLRTGFLSALELDSTVRRNKWKHLFSSSFSTYTILFFKDSLWRVNKLEWLKQFFFLKFCDGFMIFVIINHYSSTHLRIKKYRHAQVSCVYRTGINFYHVVSQYLSFCLELALLAQTGDV